MPIQVAFFDIGNTLVDRRNNWMPGAQNVLGELKTKGVRLGLISNTGNLDRDQLQDLLPGDFDFDVFEEGLVILSSEVGVEKPNLGIFLLAVQHAGVSPWETAFIGEELDQAHAAQSAGMRSLRINAQRTAADYQMLLTLFE